ncbi:hypothetical protein BC830DRAFT_1142481 [Chytriomyces sp. MP71]|nr:hypothetical protein BC830DRAFT_1142481 [Chytriomyces sp. MP71]
MTTCGGIIQAIGALTGNWQVGAVNIANTFNVQPSVVVQVASHFGSYFRNFNRFNACFNAVSGLNFATAPAMSTVSTPLVFQNQCITFGGATVIQTRAINNFISTNTNLGLTMQTCGGIIQAIGALGTNANWGTACTAIAGQFGISARTVSIVANAFMPMVQQIGQVYPSFQGVAAVSSEVGLGGGIVYDASFDNTNATDVASSASVSRSVAVGGLFAFALLFI